MLNRDDLCERFITYSIVTNPLPNFSWHQRALMHDASDPYQYFRLLPDNRIIFGGEDKTFKGKAISEKKANKIYDKVEKDLLKLFPQIEKEAKIDYKFCGCFGTTKDNLGLIGQSGFDENILLFISCGANGIINAMRGIEVIEDIIKGKENILAKLFSPLRGSL